MTAAVVVTTGKKGVEGDEMADDAGEFIDAVVRLFVETGGASSTTTASSVAGSSTAAEAVSGCGVVGVVGVEEG